VKQKNKKRKREVFWASPTRRRKNERRLAWWASPTKDKKISRFLLEKRKFFDGVAMSFWFSGLKV